MSDMESNAESITARVRHLRKRSGLSMGTMAKALGYKGASSYQRYEDPSQYKDGYLKRDLVEKLWAVLQGRGNPPITYDEVWELAGPEFASVKSNARIS